MRTSTLTLTAVAALLMLNTSCIKTDNNTGTGSSSGLDAGKATMSCSSDNSAIGSFNASNQSINSAVFTSSTSSDQITITANETGLGVKNAQLAITLPKGSTTSSGNITGDFNHSSGATVKPVMIIGASGVSGSESFASETGSVVITKLTATEVEGTFSGNFINKTKGTSTNITSGSFAGKFDK